MKPLKYRHYNPKNLAVVRLDGKDYYLDKYGSAAQESILRQDQCLAARKGIAVTGCRSARDVG